MAIHLLSSEKGIRLPEVATKMYWIVKKN